MRVCAKNKRLNQVGYFEYTQQFFPKTMLRITFFFIGTLITTVIQAQAPSVQDCLGAIPICQQIYDGDPIPAGIGDVMDFESDDTCFPFETNSIWYTFTVNNTGQFGFVLTPDFDYQDFDWVLFDITNANCEDLFDNPSLVVSCNSAGGNECNGQTGATGASIYQQQGSNCSNFPPDINNGYTAFNDLIDVVAGNTYALCVSDFSLSPLGYTLDFGLSAGIGIYDDIPPFVDNVDYLDPCGGQEILVQFSEFIQCSTIDASNFQLSGPGGPYSLTLSSANCDANGNFSKEFILHISPPIPPDATTNLILDVDGSTEALDLCDNPSEPASLNLDAPNQSVQVDLGPDTSICSGETIILESELMGTYSWSDGSSGLTLQVSDSGVYWVDIDTPCGLVSDTVEIFQSNDLPVVNLGNDTILCPSEILIFDVTNQGATYLWQDGSTDPTFSVSQPGNYAVSVSNECGEVQDQINVSIADPITAELNGASLCPGESIDFDVTSPGASYLWQDGSTNPTYAATAAGTYSVTVSNACETVELSADVLETAPPLPNIDLGNDTTLCPGESLLLEIDVPNVSIVWQDGSTNPTFQVNQPGQFSASISNACDEVQDQINVNIADPITAELDGASLCPGESVDFDVTSPGASYLWQDGSTNPTYTATAAGTYSVTISNACESVELSAEVLETAPPIPDFDLGNDTTLCPGESLLLEIDVPNVSIIWQDGSTNPTFQVNQPGQFSVSVSNACDEVQEQVNVDFADPIIAELADATLCLGENVDFDVTNAGASYLWQDGSTNATFTATTAGTFSVTISNACESVELSAEVQETAAPIPAINLGDDTSLCPGESLLLELNIPDVSIVWQDGTQAENYLVTSPGNYWATVSNECESLSDSIEVNFWESISASLVQDTFLCPGENLLLDVADENASSYLWQDNSSSPIYTVNKPGIYSVIVENQCEAIELSVDIENCEICNVYVPNALSPNNDGINDSFQPYLNCHAENFDLKVFNRWGALIFETNMIDNGWDGTVKGQIVDNGVYVYLLRLSVLENGKARDVNLSGDITVIK